MLSNCSSVEFRDLEGIALSELPPPPNPHPQTAATSPDDDVSRRRAAGAGIGLLIVVLTYAASRYGEGDRYWAAAAVILVAVFLADAIDDARSLLPIPGAAPLTIVATLGAVVLCVPETDQMAVAALMPGVVIALEVVQRRQLGIEWYAVAAASVGWAAMFGATGRQSALVGALFAWWPIVLLSLVHTVRPISSLTRAIGVAAIGAIAAVVMARTGGIADSWSTVAVSGLGSAGLSFAAAIAIASAPTRVRAAGAA